MFATCQESGWISLPYPEKMAIWRADVSRTASHMKNFLPMHFSMCCPMAFMRWRMALSDETGVKSAACMTAGM